MILRNNGQISHSVDDTLKVLDCGCSTVCYTSESQEIVAYHNGHVRQLRLWYLDSLLDLLDEWQLSLCHQRVVRSSGR